MSTLGKCGEMLVQEVCQRTLDSAIKNPQAAISIGVAAAPYVAGIVVGGAIGYGLGWAISKIFSNNSGGSGPSSPASTALLYA